MQKIWLFSLFLIVLIAPANIHAQDEVFREVLVISQDDFVLSIDWHPTEDKLASASGNSVYIWDTESGDLLQSFEAHTGGIGYVEWSPDGSQLATLGGDLQLGMSDVATVWDVDTESVIHRYAIPAYTVRWSPDGEKLLMITELANPRDLEGDHLLFSLYGLNVFSVWAAESGEALWYASFTMSRPGWTHAQNNPVHAVWLSNEEFLGINSWGEITIWSIEKRQLSRFCGELRDDPFGALQDIDWNPHTRQVAIAINDSRSRAYGFSILSIDPEEVIIHIESPEFVDAVAWCPDGRVLATGGSTNAIRLWDANTFEELAVIPHNERVWSSSWSPDGRFLATAEWGTPGTIRIWEIMLY
jgi:WD40 repeat protein